MSFEKVLNQTAPIAPVVSGVSSPDKKTTRRHRRPAASSYLKTAWGLDVAPRTLAKWASQSSTGPVMEYAGRFPLYPEDGLDAWAEAKLCARVANTTQRRLQRAA